MQLWGPHFPPPRVRVGTKGEGKGAEEERGGGRRGDQPFKDLREGSPETPRLYRLDCHLQAPRLPRKMFHDWQNGETAHKTHDLAQTPSQPPGSLTPNPSLSVGPVSSSGDLRNEEGGGGRQIARAPGPEAIQNFVVQPVENVKGSILGRTNDHAKNRPATLR